MAERHEPMLEGDGQVKMVDSAERLMSRERPSIAKDESMQHLTSVTNQVDPNATLRETAFDSNQSLGSQLSEKAIGMGPRIYKPLDSPTAIAAEESVIVTTRKTIEPIQVVQAPLAGLSPRVPLIPKRVNIDAEHPTPDFTEQTSRLSLHVTDYAISVARARLSPTPMDVFLRREAASQPNVTKRTEQAGVGIAEPSPLSTRDHFANTRGNHSVERRKAKAELSVTNKPYAVDKVGGYIISPRSPNNISQR